MNETQTAGPAESAPVTVRAMREDDLEAGLGLAVAAGWNQRLEDWRLVHALSPRASFAAFVENRLAGTTVTVNYGNKVSWIAMVLVDPAMRRRGIATKLMTAALDALAGCDAIKLDATPAGREVYLKLGFVDESTVIRFQRAAGPPPAPAGAGRLRIRPLVAGDRPAMAALDGRAFGTDRTELLTRLADMTPEYAWAAEGPGGLEGFCLGRHGRRWEFLGPLAASGEEAARELAGAAFRAMGGKPVLVDAPAWQPGFQAWLRELGFEEQRPFIRMRKGPDRHPGQSALVYGIAGPEFG